MRADDALRQTLDREVLEANLAIGLSSGVHDDEISRMAGIAEMIFNAFVEGLGHAHEREAVDGDSRSVGDRRHGLLDRGESHNT